MLRTLQPWLACAISCAVSAGCAMPPKLPDVGAVVVAPQARPAPVPTIVQEVEPLPLGYFQTRRLQRMKTPTSPTE